MFQRLYIFKYCFLSIFSQKLNNKALKMIYTLYQIFLLVLYNSFDIFTLFFSGILFP